MSYYFPQAAVTLSILFEDYKASSKPSDKDTKPLVVQPKNLSFNMNDYKTSDTFEMELDYKSFPFDPRSIRACGVTIHIEDSKRLYKDDGSLNLITPTKKNTVFQGFVDEESIEFSDSRRSVKFSGRDLTALLIDQKYEENTPVFHTLPIDQAIAAFLAQFPATKAITVKNISSQNPLPTLAQYYPDFGAPLAGGTNTGSGENYWGIIQDLVARAGLIAYMSLDVLYISDPRTVFKADRAVKFIYGKNIKTLNYKRKLGRHKGFNVAVRSLAGKEVITAKIPEEATPEWCRAVNLPQKRIQIPKLNADGSIDTKSSSDAPYLTFRILKIKDHATLVKIGEKVFEELIRQDLEGDLETLDMLSHSGDADDDPQNYRVYDLTTAVAGGVALDIGQPVSIDIDSQDVAAITRFAKHGQRVRYLESRGYSKDVAELFSRTIGKQTPIFYTKAVQISMDQANGFKMKLSFINYIDLSNKGIQ